jgi:tetratricopeptide (TPR) repeat protein
MPACLDETTTLELLEGRLTPEREAAAKKHIDECEDCRELVAIMAKATIADAPPESRLLDRGRTVGRYVVLDVIGAGGMGIVYSAFDPDLDRKVAVKLLRGDSLRPGGTPGTPGDNDELQRRLRREAQAMARLSHPNVVSVYDVGSVGAQVFVAMELVEGESLGRWLKAGDRSWREVLEVYVQAGRGLAAAHAAGVVHRDFKPDNVIVGEGGRASVTDFGLARTLDMAGRDSGKILVSPSSARKVDITHPGAMAGTPAYMSPEQMRGEPADARSDQFSFSVALYEGLYRERPFPPPPGAMTFELMREGVLTGKIKDPPSDTKIPAWVRRVLLRGLSQSPRDRFASMDDLLAALVPVRWKVRQRFLIAAGIVGIALAALLGYRARQAQGLLCKGADRHLAGVWDGHQKQHVHEAFAATKAAYAEDAWRGVEKRLDEFAKSWVAMRTDACEATRLRGEQSEELLDLRVECLDRHLRQVAALTRVFSDADPMVVERAVEAAESLPSLAECANAAALKAAVRPPKNPQTAAAVDALHTQIEQVKALERAGRYKQALAPAEAAVARARTTEYLPVEAEALHALGRVHGGLGEGAKAEEALREAAEAAEVSGHHEIGARAWIDLIYFIGNRQARYEPAHPWNRYAQAAIERLGGNDELEADRLNAHSIILWKQGREDEALSELQRALPLYRKGADQVAVARVLDGIAAVYIDQGKLEAANELDQEAVGMAQGALGPTHPTVGLFLNNMGNELRDQGRYEEAREALRRSLDIVSTSLGPETLDMIAPLDTMGTVLGALGRFDEALSYFARAKKILDDGGMLQNPDYAAILSDTGDVRRARHELDQALQLHAEARAIVQKTLGPEHGEVGMCMYRIGEDLMALGRWAEALEQDERALAIVERALGADSLAVASVLGGIGRAELGGGAPERAIPRLERALSIRTTRPGQPRDLAETRFALARALRDAGRDRDRARSLATQAREGLVHSVTAKERVAAVDAWLGLP